MTNCLEQLYINRLILLASDWYDLHDKSLANQSINHSTKIPFKSIGRTFETPISGIVTP